MSAPTREIFFALALALVACGGAVSQNDDAGSELPPGCVHTSEYANYVCTFCVPNAALSTCGNIGAVHEDGTITYGCCLDGTPVCRQGVCAETP